MKIKIIPEEEFIIDNMVKAISKQSYKQEKGYSSTIEFGITELVKIYMRKIAQHSEYFEIYKDNLLKKAIAKTKSIIQRKLKQHQICVELSSIFKNLDETLKFPAREITELRDNLSKSIENKRIGSKETFDDKYEIIEIGLKDSIEGLLAKPSGTIDLDLHRISKPYKVKGEWFPFQITKEEFIFVLDDDGSLFISTENFPPSLFEKAYSELEDVVIQIYFQ